MDENDAPGETTTIHAPKRKYRLSPEALVARRANLEKARAAPKELIYRSTEKRHAASRANLENAIQARNSPEGNANVQMNALKHGLNARKVAESVARLGEDAGEYREHLASFTRYFGPRGYVETELVRRLADTFWRRLRLYAAQIETEKRVLANYMRLQPEAQLDAAETEGRGEGLLYFFNRYSVDSLEAAHTRRQQFQSQIECSLRALVKARGGQDFQMLARRRDARWLTQLDSKWVLFDRLIEDPKVSAEEALRVLAASEEIEKQGQG
jgi:hypothetical protein